MANLCMQCEQKLLGDDIGIYMKLVSRTAKEFLCMECLAKKLGCKKEDLEALVKRYREAGNCVLFK